MMIILNLNWLPHQTEMEIACLGKQISVNTVIFCAINRGNNPRNGICNDRVGLVTMSVSCSVHLKVEDYEMENKTHAC